jgi:hypothetical protein
MIIMSTEEEIPGPSEDKMEVKKNKGPFNDWNKQLFESMPNEEPKFFSPAWPAKNYTLADFENELLIQLGIDFHKEQEFRIAFMNMLIKYFDQ